MDSYLNFIDRNDSKSSDLFTKHIRFKSHDGTQLHEIIKPQIFQGVWKKHQKIQNSNDTIQNAYNNLKIW